MAACAFQGNTRSYVYGSDGIRHQSTVNGTTTNYVLDNSMFVREQRGGSNYATYLVGPRGPEYRRDDTTGSIRWYVYDGLGSVAAEVDPSGTVTAKRKYDVYGLVRSGDAGTSAHKFVGALGHPSEAESGLVYMQARYMDPALGRFVSQDPACDGCNWFDYCAGNPVNARDPSGMFLDLMLGAAFGDMIDSGDAGATAAAEKWGIGKIEDACAYWSGRIFGEILGEELEGSYSVTFNPGYCKMKFGPGKNDYIGLDFANHIPHIDLTGKFAVYIIRTYRIGIPGAIRIDLFIEGFEDAIMEL